MADTIVPPARASRRLRGATAFDRMARRLVLARLARLRHGRIRVVDGCEDLVLGVEGGAAELEASVRVHDPRFYREVVLGGSLGAAEAFVQGWWSADNLTDLLRIFVIDAEAAGSVERGLARTGSCLARLAHRVRANTGRGSRVNIRAHYDLGNEFFEQFLDSSLTYSCAVFARPDMTLEEAQREKLDRACRKLDLSAGDHVLEIGTGWGSFAIHAASTYGCRVTTITVSPAQHELAASRVREAGLADRVRVLLSDYRDVRGQFDKLVSIEMIEAVGERFLDTYFRQCCRLLKCDGAMLLQAIVIADRHYDAYRRSADFIQTYVFPGGFLPSRGAIVSSVCRATDMRLIDWEDLTPHYVTTLREWRQRLRVHADTVRALGYPETLLRLWAFYFSYCEAGFAERHVGDAQVLLARPGWRGERVR